MRTVRFPHLVGVLALLLATVAWAAPAQAQQPTAGTHVGQVQTPDGRVLVGAIVDADGWTSLVAISENDNWNQQHARWFKGRFVNGQIAAQSTDGTTLTATLGPNGLTGTVGGQQFTVTPVAGNSTAGVYVGGNSNEVIAVIEAPDGTRIARVWSRATGQHMRTILLPSAGSSDTGSFGLLSLDVNNQQGGPGGMGNGTISANPNGSLNVSSGDASWNVAWCTSSFC